MMATVKRTIEDIHLFEVEVDANLTDEEIIEGFNTGEIDGHEFDGRIRLEPADA
jgi:hypothetical protein